MYYTLLDWKKSPTHKCPTCHGSVLIAFRDGEPTTHKNCHKCGSLTNVIPI